MTEAVSIDGFGPVPLRRPGSVAEVGEWVREAAGAGSGIYPVGGRTTLDLGLPPTKPGFAVEMTALDRIIDYPARDLTITLEAGVTLAKLQQVLAAENQWLPIDVGNPERATIGGAIATNASGPRRYGSGTLRDYVIGIRFVTDAGVEVKGGGQVVKNVAGYDLMKLHLGAIGSLGIITQVTLKVKPKPEESRTLVFGCETAELGPLLDLLHKSSSRPVAVELLNASTWRAANVGHTVESDWVLAVGFEEKQVTIAWQVATLLADLNAASVANVIELRAADADRLWNVATSLQTRPESRFIWKANILPSKVAEFATRVLHRAAFLIHAEALNGIVWLHAAADLDPAADFGPLTWMDQQSSHAGGTQVVRRCPVEWKNRLRIWGRPTAAWTLMRHIKQTLDPNIVFNPGRLFAEK